MDHNASLRRESLELPLRRGAGARVERTPLDAARIALAEVDQALDDDRLALLLGDRRVDVLELFQAERRRILKIISGYEREAEAQLRQRLN